MSRGVSLRNPALHPLALIFAPFLEQQIKCGAIKPLAIVHYPNDTIRRGNVIEGVSAEQNQIGFSPDFDDSIGALATA